MGEKIIKRFNFLFKQNVIGLDFKGARGQQIYVRIQNMHWPNFTNKKLCIEEWGKESTHK